MAKERNYKREAETAKERGETKIGFKATIQFNDDFAAKCAENGTNKNAVLKQFAYEYTYGKQPK